MLVCIMTNKDRTIEKIISDIDWFVIEKIRELRSSKFSQAELSREIGFSDGFIGRVENPVTSVTYNLRHINLISKALGVNISHILPKAPLTTDLVKIVIQLGQPTKKAVGKANYVIISKVPLTETEVEDYNKNVLHRRPKNSQVVKTGKRKSAAQK